MRAKTKDRIRVEHRRLSISSHALDSKTLDEFTRWETVDEYNKRIAKNKIAREKAAVPHQGISKTKGKI